MSARRLRLELKPSPLLALAIFVAHGLAAVCVLATLPGGAGALIAIALLALGTLAAWRQALRKAGSSVRSLEIEGTRLAVFLTSGDSFAAEVAARRYVGRLVVILAVRRPVRRTILVTRDMLGADSFRRLRIWALWGRLPGVAAKQLTV